MSNALNLIIARGFGPEVAGLGTAYSDARMQKQRHDTDQRTAEQNLEAGQLGIDAAKGMQADRDEIGQIFDEIQSIEPALNEMRTGVRQYPGLIEYAGTLNDRLQAELKRQAMKREPVKMFELLSQPPQRQGEVLTGAEVNRRYKTNLPEESSWWIDPKTGKPAALDKGPQTVINNSVGVPKPPSGYLWNDPSNPGAGVKPIAGGPNDDSAERRAAYDAFDSAMTAVEQAFEGTWTGPVVGQLPAYTEGQQKAVGAVATLAPILKQIFRAAGEGVFTDRDQQLLLDMAPKRTDHPTVAKAKASAIRQVVAAKMGMDGGSGSSGATSDGGQRWTTQGGATVEIIE